MTDESAAISVTKTLYTGSDTPIAPGGGGVEKKLDFVLEQIAGGGTTPDPTWYDPSSGNWVPGTAPFGSVANYATVGAKSMILNIETTGTKPWQSRICDICVMVPGDPTLPVMHFLDEDEATLLRGFVNWFASAGIEEIVGYNVMFDLRFIFVACMRYRIKIPIMTMITTFDLMQTMEQIWQKFAYGNNPTGTLENWALYLFNREMPMTQTEEFAAWAAKDYEKVKGFSDWKVNTEFLLLSLIEYTLTY